MRIFFYFFIFYSPFICAQKNSYVDFWHYNLNAPDLKIELPKELLEISGICEITKGVFACIQDENGIVFHFSLEKEKVIGKYKILPDGDYEGIAVAGNILYILRSDATLFGIENYMAKTPLVSQYKTKLPSSDSEGLCYDKKRNRLLIAGKEGPVEDRNLREVYAFAPGLGTIIEKPVLTIHKDSLLSFVVKNNIALWPKKSGKARKVSFYPSAISVHPVSGDFYIISAGDHTLLVLSSQGILLAFIPLNPLLFPQPEGITFMENGNMFISNEGKKNKATLLGFNYKP